MKKIIVMVFYIFLIGCKGQNNDKISQKSKDNLPMEITDKKLDVDKFKRKAKIVGSHYSIDSTYTEKQYQDYELEEVLNNKTIKIRGSESSGFLEEIKYKNTDIIELYSYTQKGSLIYWTKQSAYGFLIEEKEYDEKGYLTHHIDYDSQFKFKWEGVKKYLETLEVKTDVKSFQEHPYPNKDIPIPQIKRGFIEKAYQPQQYPATTKKIWYIEGVEGTYNGVNGIFYIDIDGDSGEELVVRQYMGKKSGENGVGTYADYKILYSKNESSKNSASIYRTYQGKDYTEVEWKTFEEEQFKKFKGNNNS